MPHFGVPRDSRLKMGVTAGRLKVGDVEIPLVVAVDPQLDHHQISVELASQLASPTQRVSGGFSLLTHNDVESLNLTSGVAHVSQSFDMAFQVTDLPEGVAAVIGGPYLNYWHSQPWKLGAILSRKHLHCSPLQ
jgi:hypothetical protein